MSMTRGEIREQVGKMANQGEVREFTVLSLSRVGGTIAPSGESTVLYGDTLSFFVGYTGSYHIESLEIDGAAIVLATDPNFVGYTTGGEYKSGMYTFSNITADHTIGVRWGA